MERYMKSVRTLVENAQKALGDLDPAFLTSPFKYLIQTLQKQLPFLKLFTCFYVNWSHAIRGYPPSAIKAVKAVNCLSGILEDILEIEIENKDTEDLENLLQVSDMFLEKLQYFKPVLKATFLEWSDLWLECKYSNKVDFKELIDIGTKNLSDLLVLKPDMIAPVKKQIGAVEKRLECVAAIFHFASRDQHVDQLNNFFNHFAYWAKSAAGVPFLYWVDIKDERLSTMVSHLIEKFKPCTLELAELYLGALTALKPYEEPDFTMKRIAVARFLEILLEDLVLPTDDGFEMLQHGLTFFISFLMNPPREYAEEGQLISTQSNLCVEEAASLICSLYASNLKGEIAKGSNILLHDLVEKMNRVKAEIKGHHLGILASSWNSFPRTNVQGFLDFFLEDLKEKLKYETTLTTYEKHQILIVQKELLSLKPLLMAVFELQNENEELKDLWTQINRMAYRVDYVIDSCLFFDPTNYWHNVMCLSNVTEEIQFIKTEVNKSRYFQVCKMRTFGDKMSSGGVLPAQANNTIVDDVVVGFTDEAEKIIDGLTRGLPQLDIVAIVGMPGKGKTTLAKKLYRDNRVRLHFQKYAWCCISQAYKIKDVLSCILKDVDPTIHEGELSGRSHEDLAEMLYRCLKGRTYLIVLDDIWDIGAWNELKASFPDDGNGSRIMFTSRIHRVALEAKPDCSLHKLHPLSFEDTWKLLQQKLSYEDGFPLNFLDIGKQIVEKCKGLPLSIVVVAGLLAKADGNLALWKQIAESLNSQVARGGGLDILELSYKHLPDYLKPCFLYLGVFSEDEAIMAKKLIEYWIAEGFVRKHEAKSLEDVAHEYLMDLAGRSLLFVAERSSRYGIKECGVHDLVRELCLEKAKEENFLLVPNISDNHSSDKMQQSYRLCFHTTPSASFQLEATAPIFRTLQYSKAVKCLGPHFIIRCKFLRVLEMSGTKIYFKIDAILQLVHLRYLALSGSFVVPSLIVNLSRLEFLYLEVDEYSFPRTIWNMRSLRRLYLWGKDSNSLDYLINGTFQLDNLETFSSDRIYSEDFKWKLRRMPNLRKLDVGLDFCLQLSSFLCKLESLSLEVNTKISILEFDLPSTLRKLKMKCCTLSASVISAIGKLPNLEVLKLFSAEFEDHRWDVDDEFLKLKCLNLEFATIKQWNVSTGSFPELQQLILSKCFDTEIPSRFGEFPTLKVIKGFPV